MSNTKRIFGSLVTGAAVAAMLVWSTPASAQRRLGFRPGFRTTVVVGGGFGWGYGYPFFYDAYDPWLYPYPAYGYPPPYYEGYYRGDSALHIQVTPKQAEVFIDGYRAGIVDDFDGIFQRLYTRPGEHDLTIYMPGFHSITQHIYLGPGQTQTIKMTMAPLAPGEMMEPPPVPQAPMAGRAGGPGPQPGYGRGGMRMMPPQAVPGQPPPPQGPPPQGPPPPPPDASAPSTPTDPSAFGTLSLRIQPSGTVVIIDGERWNAPGNGDALVIKLSEGRHHIEVHRPGFVTFSNDVEIKRGDTNTLNVSLIRG